MQEAATHHLVTDPADPKCDSCLATRSEIGGEWHVRKHGSGYVETLCDVCYHDTCRGEIELAEFARHLAGWHRARNMSTEELHALVANVAAAGPAEFERLTRGEPVYPGFGPS